MASIYANSWEQKKLLTYERSSTTTGFVWNTNIAAALLFWNTNMAAVTSRENAPLSYRSCHWRVIGWPFSHSAITMLCWDTFMGGPGMSLNLQIGRLGFWNLCDMRRTEKQVVHISLLKTLLLFMECRSRLRDCPRNIDVRVFIWYFKSLRGLQFQFLLWFEAFTEALESFCKISHRAMLKEHVPGFMVFNSLLLKGTYFCLIFWISKDSRTENWDELQK